MEAAHARRPVRVIDDGVINIARDHRARFVAGNLGRFAACFAVPRSIRLHMRVGAVVLAAVPFVWLYARALHSVGLNDPPGALFAVLAGSIVSSIGGFSWFYSRTTARLQPASKDVARPGPRPLRLLVRLRTPSCPRLALIAGGRRRPRTHDPGATRRRAG